MIFDCNIVSAQEIERVIRCVMDNNIELWKKVKEMKKKSRKALLDGGSSYSYLRCFVEDLMINIMENK